MVVYHLSLEVVELTEVVLLSTALARILKYVWWQGMMLVE
jgi:hypothetical protein